MPPSTKPTERLGRASTTPRYPSGSALLDFDSLFSMWIEATCKQYSLMHWGWVLVLDSVPAGRQQRGSSREGGCKEDSQQGIYGKPAHRDRNPQVCTTPSYSSAQGLSGNDTEAPTSISILPSVLAAMLLSNKAFWHCWTPYILILEADL